jgi:hypothetical protein
MAAEGAPDRSRVRVSREQTSPHVRAIAIAIGLFLLAVGVFGFVVGLHDAALRDDPRSVKVVGVLLTVAGLVVIVAGVALLVFATNRAQVQRWSGRLVLAACLIVAGAAGYFVVAAIRSLDRSWATVALAATVIVLAILSLRFFERVSGVTLGKVGAFLLTAVGIAFGAVQFWYQQEYVPAHAPAALSLTTKLAAAGTRGSRELYTATVTLKNVGSGRVIAFTGTYRVSGIRWKRGAGDATPEVITSPFKSKSVDPYFERFSRYYAQTDPTPVTVGKLFAENEYLEAGEELSREYLIAIPECAYSVLSLRANTVIAKGELLRPSREPTTDHYFFRLPVESTDGGPPTERTGVAAVWHLEDNSWLKDLVDTKERWLHIVWDYSPTRNFVTPSVWLSSDGIASAKETENALKKLGLATTFSDFELAIPTPERAGAQKPACN